MSNTLFHYWVHSFLAPGINPWEWSSCSEQSFALEVLSRCLLFGTPVVLSISISSAFYLGALFFIKRSRILQLGTQIQHGTAASTSVIYLWETFPSCLATDWRGMKMTYVPVEVAMSVCEVDLKVTVEVSNAAFTWKREHHDPFPRSSKPYVFRLHSSQSKPSGRDLISNFVLVSLQTQNSFRFYYHTSKLQSRREKPQVPSYLLSGDASWMRTKHLSNRKHH